MYGSRKIFIFLTFFASCYSYGKDRPHISFLNTNIDTGGVKFSGGPTANLNSISTIFSKIKFYVPSKPRSGTSLTIEVTLPFKNSTGVSYIKEHFQYEKTFVYKPRVQLLSNSVQVEIDGVSLSQRFYSFKKKNSYTYILTVIPELIPVHINFVIKCSYKAKVPSSVNEVGSLYNFKFRASLGNVSKTNSATLKIIGPRVSITPDPPNIIMDAGQELAVKFIITSHPLFTSNLCNLKVSHFMVFNFEL